MLRYWNNSLLILLAIMVSSNLILAQEESKTETEAVIWVLIERNNVENDSTVTKDHAKMMRQHMDYLSKIHSEKKMLASISFQGGGGLMFFKNNKDSIKKWMSVDPAIADNLFKLSYYTWIPEKGNICQTDNKGKLGNFQVTFIRPSSPKDPDLRERIKNRQRKLISDLKAKDETICLGKIKEGNAYALISKNPTDSEEMTDLGKSGGGILKETYKAWAPTAAFCD